MANQFGDYGRNLSGFESSARSRLKSLEDLINKQSAQGPTQQLKMETGTFQQSAPLKQFDIARQKASQAVNNQANQGVNAMNRRFAAMGSLNSGAAIKSGQQARDEAMRQEQAAFNDINAQEEATRFQVDQANLNRQDQLNQRNFQREVQNQNQAFQDKVFSFDSNSKLAQLDQALTNQLLEADAQEFNKRLQVYQAKNSGGLFGGGGFLGLGF